MRNIDVIINAIVEEGLITAVLFIPILTVVVNIFRLCGLSLFLGVLVSIMIATALFVVRLYLRLKEKTVVEKNVKEAALAGVIVSATFLVYTAIYSAVTSLNSVPFVIAFVTYILWRYYGNLEGAISVKRVVKLCIFVSIFNVALGFIYALEGLSFTLTAWFSCWIGLIVALIISKRFIANRVSS